jgi:hypothetical protein
MMKVLLRVWKELDPKDIEKSLIVVGELSSECYVCHDLGLDLHAVQCPHCGTFFKYVGFRRKINHNFLRQIKESQPDVVLIDFDDFKKLTHQSDARKLLDL